MSLAPIGFGIIALAIMGMVIARYAYMYSRAKLGAPDAPGKQQADAELKQEVARLRDRVRVLEELATDGDRKLAGDIERLRRPDMPASL